MTKKCESCQWMVEGCPDHEVPDYRREVCECWTPYAMPSEPVSVARCPMSLADAVLSSTLEVVAPTLGDAQILADLKAEHMKAISRPRIGVSVVLMNNGKVLLGKRKGSHGAGTWSFPGGHLDFRETPRECAKREVYEETGIMLLDVKEGPYTNDFFVNENLHYLTLFMWAETIQEPKVMEPDKCEAWGWFDWDYLPAPLFLPIHNLLAMEWGVEDFKDAFEFPGDLKEALAEVRACRKAWDAKSADMARLVKENDELRAKLRKYESRMMDHTGEL